MPNYNCEICSYITNKKSNYQKHILSAKHNSRCGIMYADSKIKTKLLPKLPKLSQLSQILENESQPLYSCEQCGQKFAQKNGYYRHRKHSCKTVEGQLIPVRSDKGDIMSTHRNTREKWKEDIDQLTVVSNTNNSLNNSHNTSNNTDNSTSYLNSHNTNYNHSNNINSNNTNSNNEIHQSIVVNNFGKDNWDHVSDKEKIELLKKPYEMIKKAFEKVNLNDDVPENHNIRVENQRNGKVLVWEDKKWRNEEKKGTMKEVVDEKYYILDSFFRDLLEKNPEKLYELMTKDEIRAYTKFSAMFDEETNAQNVNNPEKQPLGDEFAEACFYSLVDELINTKMQQRDENKEKEEKIEERREERREEKRKRKQPLKNHS